MLYLTLSLVAFYFIGILLGAYYKSMYPERPIKWAHVFNPLKWVSVAISAFMFQLMPPHIVEQLCLRLYDKECKDCVKQGFCKDCGCAMPEKAFDPYAHCSLGNWGPMILSRKEYEKHREQFPIKINIDYVKVR